MTTPQHRTNEFKKRQIFYDEGFSLWLSKKGKIYTYITFAKIKDSIVIADCGRYNDEDPLDLIAIGRAIIGRNKAGKITLTPDLVRGKAKKGVKKR